MLGPQRGDQLGEREKGGIAFFKRQGGDQKEV